jgi:hypothetical protein
MLKRHVKLRNCILKLLYIFMVGNFPIEFEEDTIYAYFKWNLLFSSGVVKPTMLILF